MEKKLLVADDSLTIQKVIRLALDKEGYDIHAVSDGQDALEEISLFRPEIVLVDVSLPTKTAYDIKTEYDKQNPKGPTKFILMSSAFEDVDEKQMIEAGFHGRLVKPFDPAHLRKTLIEALNLDAPPPDTSPELGEDLWNEDTGGGPNEDIKKMTEETISMSGGLDQFEWSVSERASKKPAIRPTPAKEKKAAVAGERTLSDLQYSEPEIEPPTHLMNVEDSSFSFNDNLSEITGIAITPPPPPMFEPAPVPAPMNAKPSGASQEQIEEMVREQVLEQVQKLLPDLAEKIIRSEINKLLSNPPN